MPPKKCMKDCVDLVVSNVLLPIICSLHPGLLLSPYFRNQPRRRYKPYAPVLPGYQRRRQTGSVAGKHRTPGGQTALLHQNATGIVWSPNNEPLQVCCGLSFSCRLLRKNLERSCILKYISFFFILLINVGTERVNPSRTLVLFSLLWDFRPLCSVNFIRLPVGVSRSVMLTNWWVSLD